MANPAPGGMITVGSGCSRTGRYPIRGAAPRGKTKKEGRSALGFIENLGKDLGGAIVGLPAGVVETVRNPIKTAGAIKKDVRSGRPRPMPERDVLQPAAIRGH